MDDETQPVSGSRWERGDQPAPAQPAATPPPAVQAEATAPSGAPVVPAYAPAPQPKNRGRLVLAGGAVGIAVVAGAGGFALGHATADDGRDGRFGGPGFGRFQQNGPGFGNGQEGPGGQQFPGFPNGGDGTQQVPPGFNGAPDGQDPNGQDDQGYDNSGSGESGSSHT